jgi:rhamnulokinase
MADFLAVDLGATSGRVAIGRVNRNMIELEIVHRFEHEVVAKVDGSLLWNWGLIFSEVLRGLQMAKAISNPISLAVDSWAVDFGFINENGLLQGPVHAYRDPRNEIAFQSLTAKIGRARIYATTGIQFLPFNTIYQLFRSKETEAAKTAKSFLLIPDLLNYLLTGVASTEVTNASSTQVLNTHTRTWDLELIGLAGIRKSLFTQLHEPGTHIGVVKGYPELNGISVIATASHDTAAAIASIPFSDRTREAYISSGTWSLVGVEVDSPVTTDAAFSANLSNELGVDGTVRVLKNVTGMWLLEECRRAWREDGEEYSTSELLSLAEVDSTFETLIDPNDQLFAAPGGMPARIVKYCQDRNLLPPQRPGEFTFCILHSLAHAYKKTLTEVALATDLEIETIHILGGGSQNDLLNQLTANVCNKIVKTGPVEATLFGNIAVQAVSAGILQNLDSARQVIGRSFTSKIFTPL